MKRLGGRSSVVSAVLFVGVAALAGRTLYRTGGMADARQNVPTAPSSATAVSTAPAASHPPRDKTEAKRDGRVDEVYLRLTEAMSGARVNVPAWKQAQPYLARSWRRLPGPWVRHPGEVGEMVQTVALLTSQQEVQWAVPTDGGKAWVPSARVWNMNEGSFDQRESIILPGPASVGFRTTLPKGARLGFAPALLMPTRSPSLMSVTLIDGTGTNHSLFALTIPAMAAQKWRDVSVDLSRFEGQNVELRLDVRADVGAAAPPRGEGDPAKEPGAPMPIGLFGHPTIYQRVQPKVPYNVLWVVIDSLRPDVIASLHDDETDQKMARAKHPPFDAHLPKIEGLVPNIDALVGRGTSFLRAYSGGAWTRPGTLSMLSGMRSSEIGIDTTTWVVPNDQATKYYGSPPPLLPLVLRKHGVSTRAFVNNFFMAGYAAVGLDMGFERLDDHRYRVRDTEVITKATKDWLKQNKDERFLLFVNYNSPHDPYDPPPEYLKRVPPPPKGPRDGAVRAYMAEAGKDDAALGELLRSLDDLGLTDSTLVVVTADHGETLSHAHGGVSPLDKMPIRFHHAVGNFEETTKIPIIFYLPGVFDKGQRIMARVQNTDIAPTLLELFGLPADPRMSGRSLMPLVAGKSESERPIVTEGRGMRALLKGRHRLLVRGYGGKGGGTPDLFDLEDDPGERKSIAKERPELVREMRQSLDALLRGKRADPQAATAEPSAERPTTHLRFAGGGQARRVLGTFELVDIAQESDARWELEPAGIPADCCRIEGLRAHVDFRTVPDRAVGFSLRTSPAHAAFRWTLALDGEPWKPGWVFAGPFGFRSHSAALGILSEEARAEAYSPSLPEVDPQRDLGMFITRDRRGETRTPTRLMTGEGAREMQRILQDWGYAGSSPSGGKK